MTQNQKGKFPASIALNMQKYREIFKIEAVDESVGNYIIRINIGERIYELKTPYQSERNKWICAMQLASKTAKELGNSKTKKSRNISQMIELYKNNKETLQQSLNANCQNFIPKNKEWKGLSEVLEACGKVREEFLIVFYLLSVNISLLIHADVKKISQMI